MKNTAAEWVTLNHEFLDVMMYPIESVGQKCRHNKPAMTDTTIMHASFGICSEQAAQSNEQAENSKHT